MRHLVPRAYFGASSTLLRLPSRLPSRIPSRFPHYYVFPLAGIVAAGLDGIQRKLEPRSAEKGIAYSIPEDSIPQLPNTLETALEALASDTGKDTY